MLSLALAALSVLSLSAADGRPPARSTSLQLVLRDEPVVQVDLTGPRMEAADFARTLADPALLRTLNAKHLPDVGRLRSARPFVLGERFVEAGTYRLGLSIDEEAALTVRLRGEDGRTIACPLETTAVLLSVPQPSVSFLHDAAVDRFALEVRFGTLAGRTTMSFAEEDVIAAANNEAWTVLSDPASDERAVRRAHRLAAAAARATGQRVPGVLDTLALAEFRMGRPSEAVRLARKALSIGVDLPKEERAAMAQRLRRYEAAVRREF